MRQDLRISPTTTVPAAALRWKCVRSSGPGGQHVNTTATKVELRLRVDRLGWDAAARARLSRLAGRRLTTDGELVLSSDISRHAHRNLLDARARLRELLVAAERGPTPRRASSPSRASDRRRLEHKRRRSSTKRLRGRVPTGD